MRILFYNLGYGRGHDGSISSYLLGAHRFVHLSKRHQRTVLDEVVRLVERERPDVLAMAEISIGSFKNGQFDQHAYLLDRLSARSVADAALSKYGETALNLAPFHAGNCNSVIAFRPAAISEIYLTKSRKRLVFRIELDTVTIFAVHLPLVSTDRRQQLLELAALVNQTKGDVVVCGDFNILDGLDELSLLSRETGLRVAGTGEPTYPSAAPRLQLDVFLYRFADAGVVPRLETFPVLASDHLPVMLSYDA